MFQSSILRPAVGLPLAALVVFGLFSFMTAMVSQEYEPPADVEQRPLVRITPQALVTDARVQPRTPPQKLIRADKPPPLPKFAAVKSDVSLPSPHIRGATPTELPMHSLNIFAIDPVAISERDAQPIRPPVLTYPAKAAQRGLNGDCEVRIDVDTRGRPYNVEATCSDSVFKSEAERAVKRVEFVPKIVRGKAAERHNVVYPLAFRIQD